MNDIEQIFLLNQVPGKYRWLSIVEDQNDWGTRLALLKGSSVEPGFGPIKVEWSPETARRPICDFPNFRTNLLCLSEKSQKVFFPLLDREGRWIELYGVKDKYSAYQSLAVIDAMSASEDESQMPDTNFHSPRFAPALHLIKIPPANAFRVPESISKIFVSVEFKRAYDDGRFTGLEFIPVRLV